MRKKISLSPYQTKKFATRDRTRVQVLKWFPRHYTATATQQKLEEI